MSERDEKYRLKMLEREMERLKSAPAPTPVVIKDSSDFYGAPKLAIKATLYGNLITAAALTVYALVYRGLTDAITIGIAITFFALASVVVQFVYYKLFWWVNGCLSLLGALVIAGAVLWALATGFRPAPFGRF